MKAYQKFTYFCKNSIGWFDTEKNDYSRSITLLGDNEFEFEGEKLKHKDVSFDGCRVRTSILNILPLKFNETFHIVQLKSLFLIIHLMLNCIKFISQT